MREIKFRAWDSKRNIMIGTDYPKNWSKEEYDEWWSNEHKMMLESIEEINMLERFSVMQFTGMKDKNGKGIYEGDVLLNHNKVRFFPENQKLIVKWQEGKFGFNHNDNSQWLKDKPQFVFEKIGSGMTLIFSQEQIEIIGNIHENPELLEKAEG